MFDDMLIVKTAINSFNNMALFAPMFFYIGVLMMPIFLIVYTYGADFISKFGNNKNIHSIISFGTAVSLWFWFCAFGFNSAVIRDGISLLNLFVPLIYSLLIMVIKNEEQEFKILEKIQNKKHKILVCFSFLLVSLLGAFMNLYGILLQFCFIGIGLALAKYTKKYISSMNMLAFILGFISILVLMQPEYFRFGQLGNLTFVHLSMVLLCGFFAVTYFITKYFKPCGKIKPNVFIKVKWLFRIILLLTLILFFLTESVPVYIGIMLIISLLEIMTIYHLSSFKDLEDSTLSLLFISFGFLSLCYSVTALGLIYLAITKNKLSYKQFFGLL